MLLSGSGNAAGAVGSVATSGWLGARSEGGGSTVVLGLTGILGLGAGRGFGGSVTGGATFGGGSLALGACTSWAGGAGSNTPCSVGRTSSCVSGAGTHRAKPITAACKPVTRASAAVDLVVLGIGVIGHGGKMHTSVKTTREGREIGKACLRTVKSARGGAALSPAHHETNPVIRL